MKIADLQAGLAVLAGFDLHLVFFEERRAWVPCAKHFVRIAENRLRGSLKILELADWHYADGIEAFIFEERQ